MQHRSPVGKLPSVRSIGICIAIFALYLLDMLIDINISSNTHQVKARLNSVLFKLDSTTVSAVIKKAM